MRFQALHPLHAARCHPLDLDVILGDISQALFSDGAGLQLAAQPLASLPTGSGLGLGPPSRESLVLEVALSHPELRPGGAGVPAGLL